MTITQLIKTFYEDHIDLENDKPFIECDVDQYISYIRASLLATAEYCIDNNKLSTATKILSDMQLLDKTFNIVRPKCSNEKGNIVRCGVLKNESTPRT